MADPSHQPLAPGGQALYAAHAPTRKPCVSIDFLAGPLAQVNQELLIG